MDPISPQPSVEPAPLPKPATSPAVLWVGGIIVLLLVAGSAYAYMHSAPVTMLSQTASSTPEADKGWHPVTLASAGQWQSSPVPTDSPLVPAPDPATFETFVWNGHSVAYDLAKDKDHAWYDGILITDADPATLNPIPAQYGSPSNATTTTRTNKKGKVITVANPNDGNGNYTTFYVRDAIHVWYPSIFQGMDCDGGNGGCADIPPDHMVLMDADAATFVPISEDIGLWEDKNHVFYSDRAISNDPENFTAATNAAGTASYWYYKDSKAVYALEGGMNPIPDADPATFTLLASSAEVARSEGGFEKDATHVYTGNHLVPGADSATFTVLMYPDGTSSFFGKDASHLYIAGWSGSGSPDFAERMFPGIPDVSSLSIIGNGSSVTYMLDAGQVYAVPDYGSDPAMLVSGADPATFFVQNTHEVDPPTDAHDKNHTYLNGKIVK